MRSPRADTSVIVNLVCEDAVLVDRIQLYADRSNAMSIRASVSPLPEGEADAFVMPAPLALTVLQDSNRPATSLPVVAYGNRSYLRLAFMAGCADYLKSPWSPEEMHLRIQRLVHKTGFWLASNWIEYAPAAINCSGARRTLSFQEYSVLRALVNNAGQAVPRDVLYYALWGQTGAQSRVVDMHVSSLRRKLNEIVPSLTGPRAGIHTVRGVGYMLVSTATEL